jgi:hypothetical protein
MRSIGRALTFDDTWQDYLRELVFTCVAEFKGRPRLARLVAERISNKPLGIPHIAERLLDIARRATPERGQAVYGFRLLLVQIVGLLMNIDHFAAAKSDEVDSDRAMIAALPPAEYPVLHEHLRTTGEIETNSDASEVDDASGDESFAARFAERLVVALSPID